MEHFTRNHRNSTRRKKLAILLWQTLQQSIEISADEGFLLNVTHKPLYGDCNDQNASVKISLGIILVIYLIKMKALKSYYCVCFLRMYLGSQNQRAVANISAAFTCFLSSEHVSVICPILNYIWLNYIKIIICWVHIKVFHKRNAVFVIFNIILSV